MTLLRTIESRIARIVEGAFGRAFRSHVQPVELARRLVKEMDEHQSHSVRKIYVPNVYHVYLSPDDFAQFEGYSKGLQGELGEYLLEHARRSGYALLTRPRVELYSDDDLAVGSFGIATQLEHPSDEPDQKAEPEPASKTMVFQAPKLQPSRFELIGEGVSYTIDVDQVSVGRGSTNDMMVADASVSREHAEFSRTASGLTVCDLNSTNGVFVNGKKVSEHVLADGDRLLLGSVEFRVRRVADAADSGSDL